MSKKNVLILKHFEAPKKPGTYARLVCLNGDNKGIAYYISSNRIILGRGDTADIRVLDIKSSREHAELVKAGSQFVITDLGSQNGIVINDLKVKQHVLKDSDKLIIGKTVYKFSIIKVDEDQITEIKNEDNEAKVIAEKPESKKNKKKIIYLAVLAAVGFLLLGEDEDIPTGKRIKEVQKADLKSFTASAKREKSKDKDKQKKMSVYFARGLREFREGNYFRAMSEFESALSWSPNDPLALFYMRKTKDALNKSVESLFNKGRRDEDSLKYKNAAVSYCAVMRLLYRYPSDERYKNAKEKVKQIEEKLGLDPDELECIQKIN